MGTVHPAKDPLIERDVAIKTLLPNPPDEVMGDVRERFLREARSAGGPFTCEIVVRGDYDKPGFVIEMENVGRSGASRFRLGAEKR